MDENTQASEQETLAAKRQKAIDALQSVRSAIAAAQAAIEPVPGDEKIGRALGTLGWCDTLLEQGGRE